MAMESFSLIFDGYWRARNAVGIPGESGIYCVYACSHDATAGTVSLGKLIYIGESENVRDRIDGHERLPDWKRHLQRGEELCFSFAPILRGRERVEAALIHHHKPPENDAFVDTFPFDTTTVSTSGRNAKLAAAFTVRTKQAV